MCLWFSWMLNLSNWKSVIVYKDIQWVNQDSYYYSEQSCRQKSRTYILLFISATWHLKYFLFVTLLTLARPWRLSSGPWWIGRDEKLGHSGCFSPALGRGSPPRRHCLCRGSHSRAPDEHPDPPLNLKPNTETDNYYTSHIRYLFSPQMTRRKG